jgi:hypothetical protein
MKLPASSEKKTKQLLCEVTSPLDEGRGWGEVKTMTEGKHSLHEYRLRLLTAWVLGSALIFGCGGKAPQQTIVSTGGELIPLEFVDETFRPGENDKINASLIQITPVPADCGGTKSQKATPQSQDNLSLKAKVNDKCDYRFDIKLGQSEEPVLGLTLDQTLYSIKTPVKVAKSQLKEHAGDWSLVIPIKLERITGEAAASDETADKAAGTPAPETRPSPQMLPSVTPSPKPSPTPTVTPTPELKVAPLFQSAMIEQKGVQSSWASKITGKYVFVDISSPYCSVCQQLASYLNSGKYAGISGKCDIFTFTMRSEYDAMVQKFQGTLVAQHTYTPASGVLTDVFKWIGKSGSLSAIPYLILLDAATGAIVAENAGFGPNSATINAFNNHCL